MDIFIKILILILIPISCSSPETQSQKKDLITIEYLGHSSFYIDFYGEVSVLTDYGKPDAYKEWGWSSPIRNMGNLHPDILTYSHRHDDHYNPERVTRRVAIRYFGDSILRFRDLIIEPIDISESDIAEPDNHAYVFTYKEKKVIHLGDCQANIMSVRDPENRKFLLEIFAAHYNIIFVPLEGQTQFTEELVEFIQLLDADVIVPMHFWSEKYKDSLIATLKNQIVDPGFEIADFSEDIPVFSFK